MPLDDGVSALRMLESAESAGNLSTGAPIAALALRLDAEVQTGDFEFGRFLQVYFENPLVCNGAPAGSMGQSCGFRHRESNPPRPGSERYLSLPEPLVVNEMRVAFSDRTTECLDRMPGAFSFGDLSFLHAVPVTYLPDGAVRDETGAEFGPGQPW